MLNLLVRLMKRTLSVLPLLLFVIAAQDSGAAITSPKPEESLRGQVNIIGSTNVPNFVSAQLDFAYASDSAGTWFPLQALSQPVFDSPLYSWDTTSITDGDYILRLRVFTADGAVQEVTVSIQLHLYSRSGGRSNSNTVSAGSLANANRCTAPHAHSTAHQCRVTRW
jgi:hypothetical protein